MKLLLKVVPLLVAIPFMWVLATVWIINNELGNELVSGKYFWFYVGMVLVAFGSLVSSWNIKRIQFSMVDFGLTFFLYRLFLYLGSAEKLLSV